MRHTKLLGIEAHEYFTEMQELAHDILAEALEQTDYDKDMAQRLVNDIVHEVVEDHQWVVFQHYHDQVLRFSVNSDAYLDVYDNEALGNYVKDKGIGGLNSMKCYWAIHQDVIENINEMNRGDD